MPHHTSGIQPDVSSNSKISYGGQLDVFLPTAGGPEETAEKDADWLVLTEKRIQQDLETLKKELELIRDILEETDMYLRTEKKASRKLRNQKLFMGACQEYSGSLCQILNERLRQVQFWLASRQIGRKIPEREPPEWRIVDIEWRQWLSEQAAMRTNKSEQSATERPLGIDDDIAMGIWGPLAHILTVYTSQHDHRAD
ncbi:hypothetical protein F4779DRAFT_641385 [Xylariaceae sp. FL0662B]|nr:hypothetical protein F4779DRAFT_641385 [Xylariaceae sp. FL0662B]